MEHLAPGRDPSVEGVRVEGEAGDIGEERREVVLAGGEVAWAAERLWPQGGLQQLLHLGRSRHAAVLVGPAPNPDDVFLAVAVEEDLGGVVGAALVAQVELGVLDDNPLPELEGNDRICGTVCPRLRDPTSRPTIGSKVSVHATFEIFFCPFIQK